MLTRRTLLQRAPLPLLGLGALGFITRMRSQAQQPQLDPRIQSHLLDTTLTTIGHPVPRQFHAMAEAYADFFDNLKTAGMLPQLEDAFFNSGLLQNILPSQILQIANGIEQSTGISTTTSLPVISGWLTNLPVLNTMLAQEGSDAVHQKIVSVYRTLAGDNLFHRDDTANEPEPSPGGGGGGNGQSNLCYWLTVLGLYTGTWGLMSTIGYLTFLSSGIGAILFAGAGLTLSVIQAEGC